MNKIVLITGATSGFGKACAEKFAAAGGYDLIITGRRKERLDALQRQLENPPAPLSPSGNPPAIVPASPASAHTLPATAPLTSAKVLPLVFDVQDRDAVFSAINNLPAAWKKINLLINNAGLALGRDFFDQASLEDWETMIDTNVKGLLYVSRAVIPLMIGQHNAQIINMGSVAGKEVYEKGNVYCATKFAVGAISRSMRIDLLRHGIKVTAIHPGAAETEFSKVRFKGDEDQAQKIYEGFTPLSAGDVADAIYYCATLPPHVCINDLVITCTAQADAIYMHKNS
jgi:3-hydroxy acid dehydrogenase / malonic semialdehyde reductase